MTGPTQGTAATVDRLIRIGTGEHLPDETVEGIDGDAVRLRGGTGDVVAVLVRHADCARCDAYERALRKARPRLERWDGRLVVMEGGSARLVVADRDAVVHEAVDAGDDHAFPGAEEVEASLRFLATQCPECGAPEGGWSAMADRSGH